jgi:hypothetical protein
MTCTTARLKARPDTNLQFEKVFFDESGRFWSLDFETLKHYKERF